MKTRHTPGPWHVTAIQQHYDSSKLTGRARLDAELYRYQIRQDERNNHVIAKTVKEYDSVNDLANAALIAAAPDLLTFCKRLLVDPESHLFSETREMLFQVIRKAEGK